MSNYIRLTIPPGYTDQAANTILINASQTAVPANQENSFYITPVRQSDPSSQVLYYDPTTKEVTYGVSNPPTTAIWGVWALGAHVGLLDDWTPSPHTFVPFTTNYLPIVTR